MPANFRERLTHFFTFQVANRVLMGLGNLMTPFSKVSSTPILPKSEFPWAKLLEDNWEQIQAEVKALLADPKVLPNIQDIQPAESLLTTDNRWKTFFLQGFGHRAEKNRALCPDTAKVLDQIPGLLTGFFSILHPGKHIPAHKGIFKGIVRTHLGLLIPGEAGQCRMRVGKEFIYWKEGEAVFFDDTYNHEVWNDSDGIRVVLLIDTIRPYRSIGRRINRFVINSITNSVYVKEALKKNEDWEKVYYNVLA
ncbi:MAG TPA: aspartyl/asparaginyl beta-hydroxylase domain-containing protein [Sediminibacterium sp.]|nr:aspartyl/asparaginyl beta-hydroxylase domain-containing protein [Sediminibacterium sp.]